MKKLKINKIEKYDNIKDVYDIQVEDTSNYVLHNGIISHNSGAIYASSIVLATKKLKLKEDDDGNKIKDVTGIKAVCKIMKSRYGRNFETCKLNIHFDKGLDEYSGALDYFEKLGVVEKNGNKLQYISKDGTEYKEFRKNFGPDILQLIMDEWDYEKYKLVRTVETKTE